MSLAEVGSTKITKREQCGQITVVKKWCFRRCHWKGAGRLQMSEKVRLEEMNWSKQKGRCTVTELRAKNRPIDVNCGDQITKTYRSRLVAEEFRAEGCVRRDTASGSIASVGEYTRDLWL